MVTILNSSPSRTPGGACAAGCSLPPVFCGYPPDYPKEVRTVLRLRDARLMAQADVDGALERIFRHD